MTLIQQFADYATTRSGPYQTDDNCHCPMADFGHTLWPQAVMVEAGETSLHGWFTEPDPRTVVVTAAFPPRFFTRFVEPFSTWEELVAALRRAS